MSLNTLKCNHLTKG